MWHLIEGIIGLLILSTFMLTIFPMMLILRGIYTVYFYGYQFIDALIRKKK